MSSVLYNTVPHIRKSEFDNEANAFLQDYYPEALLTPMAVPIKHVARHKMGLRVVERHLTEDFSILGQMCFTSGLTEIFDNENDEYKLVRVRYGTMIIDPDTIRKRNNGCKNNTIAHECVHWHKHRDYFIATSIRADNMTIEQRCDSVEKSESTQYQWTGEDWMEWQARGIAARILMPIDQFKIMVERFLDLYSNNSNAYRKECTQYRWMVNNLAEFFKVSKQSAEIRLEETGYNLH